MIWRKKFPVRVIFHFSSVLYLTAVIKKSSIKCNLTIIIFVKTKNFITRSAPKSSTLHNGFTKCINDDDDVDVENHVKISSNQVTLKFYVKTVTTLISRNFCNEIMAICTEWSSIACTILFIFYVIINHESHLCSALIMIDSTKDFFKRA